MGTEKSPVRSWTRDGSLCGLTLNEVENHLGEPLHSMNLDELLKSVFPAEGSQNLSVDFGGDVSSGLSRQGSVTVPRTLSNKTVDALWKDIQQSQGEKGDDEERNYSHEGQLMLGEMTLEDFLTKAGVVAEGIAKEANDVNCNAAVTMEGTVNVAQSSNWLQYQQKSMGQQIERQKNAMEGYVGAGKRRLVPVVRDSVHPNSSSMLLDSKTSGSKRGGFGDEEEKVVERRRKRMIKNRESASRSRARKQAYTNELEDKVLRLERENLILRKEKLKATLNAAPEPPPKQKLKRSNSAAF